MPTLPIFVITGHPHWRRASTPNAVALYIGADVLANDPALVTPFSRDAIAREVSALTTGESTVFRPVDPHAAPVRVTRS
jgi:NhaP-type Na+/H+ or K+/H+ antiporter